MFVQGVPQKDTNVTVNSVASGVLQDCCYRPSSRVKDVHYIEELRWVQVNELSACSLHLSLSLSRLCTHTGTSLAIKSPKAQMQEKNFGEMA